MSIYYLTIWSVSRPNSEFRYMSGWFSGQGSFIVVVDSQPKGSVFKLLPIPLQIRLSVASDQRVCGGNRMK